MKLRRHSCLWISLLLVACDKQRDAAPSGRAEGAKSTLTRPRRPASEPDSDPREELRGALKSALATESPADREKAVAEVAWNALDLDPQLARDAFSQLSAGGAEKLRLIQHFAMTLAERNLDEAIQWADALESESESAAAYGQIALVLSNSDPGRAANLLSESGVAGRDLDVAVVQVLQRWAEQSPPQAAAWTALFPAGAAREAGFQVVVAQWAKTDAPALLSWISKVEDETLRKEAALAMAGALLQQAPEVREQWLQSADSRTRSEIERQKGEALKQVGERAPVPAK